MSKTKMNYTVNTKVTFRVSTNRVRSECEETFTFGDLGINIGFINAIPKYAVENIIDELYSEWKSNQLDCSWHIEKETK